MNNFTWVDSRTNGRSQLTNTSQFLTISRWYQYKTSKKFSLFFTPISIINMRCLQITYKFINKQLL